MNLIQKLLVAILYGAVFYFVFAMVTFKVRHPWATKVEVWVNIGSALTLDTVPYDEMRPRR
jgi:hypothetical protein